MQGGRPRRPTSFRAGKRRWCWPAASSAIPRAAHATALGIEVEVIDFGKQAPADPARLEAALRADREGRIKAVLTTHVDTATTVRNDIPALRRAIDAAGHPALFAVDCIASMGCDEFRMDDWGWMSPSPPARRG
ncbi:hypothetical protein MASR1M32_23690 [Rhodobacter sp.]